MQKQLSLLDTLESLISNLNESLIIINQNGLVLHCSKEVDDLISEISIKGENLIDRIHDGKEALIAFLNSDLGITTNDIRITYKRGNRLIPFRVRFAKWNNAEGGCIAIGSFVDATQIERKKRALLRKTLAIENLSKSPKIRNGKLYDAIYEILVESSHTIGSTRVNAWLFNENNTMIECIGNFDNRQHVMLPQEDLPVMETPAYFSLFETQKIILAIDAQNDKQTAELTKNYLKPNNILSLMDIPIRSEGNIIGVVCFEQVGIQRVWDLEEQKFALITAQLLTLAIETHNRKIFQQGLEKVANYRQSMLKNSLEQVINNIALCSQLMEIKLESSKDRFHKQLLLTGISRLDALQILYQLIIDENLNWRIPFDLYVERLIESVRHNFETNELKIQINLSVDQCELSAGLAAYLGVFINEVLSNLIKFGFKERPSGVVMIDFTQQGANGILRFIDNGSSIENVDSDELQVSFRVIEHLIGLLNAEIVSGSDSQLVTEIKFKLK